jgi:hypothetical protein
MMPKSFATGSDVTAEYLSEGKRRTDAEAGKSAT